MTNLSEKQIDTIARAAVQTALEFMEKEKKRQEKAKCDRRLRNIKLLLKNYRNFKNHCAGIKLELNELDEELKTYVSDSNELKIEAIKRSKQRTLAMVRFIDQMFEVYKVMCEKSNDKESKRRYKVIYAMYISDEKTTAEKIGECHFIDKRTVFRDVNKACETLAVLMFGVDGIRFK